MKYYSIPYFAGRYFIPILFALAACDNEKVEITISGGEGSGKYKPGSEVSIEPGAIGDVTGDSLFVKWSGGEGFIEDVYSPETKLLVPGKSLAIRAEFRSPRQTGISDLDELIESFSREKTNEKNIESRRAGIFRWYRFLWRQGIDFSSFRNTANQLLINTGSDDEACMLIDKACEELKHLSLNGKKIPEVKAASGNTSSDISKTDWLSYMGTDGTNRGYSPDPGPSAGEIAWKFPRGYISEAAPVVKDGRVYITSPGIDVMGYCLEEKTGEVIWTSRQFGTNFYSVPGIRETPEVRENHLVYYRRDPVLPYFLVDRENGKKLSHGETPESEVVVTAMRGTKIACFNGNDTNPVWVFDSRAQLAGFPVITDSLVFFTCSDGMVYCLSKPDGHLKWKAESGDLIRTSPQVNNSRVFIRTESGKIISLSAFTGQTQWIYEAAIKENKAYRYFSAFYFPNEGKQLYIGSAAKELLSIDRETGKLIWRLGLDDWIRSAPVMADNKLFVADLSGMLYKIEDLGSSGRVLEKMKINEHGFTADMAATENGILLAGRDQILYSVSPVTGNLQWKHGIINGTWVDGEFFAAGWSGGLLGSPVVTDGMVICGGPDGFVVAADAETGKEIWRFETNSSVSLSPRVAEGMVYFGYLGSFSEHYGYEKAGELFALDVQSGEPVWRCSEYGKIWVAPEYSDGKLFLGNVDGWFYAIEASTGRKVWEYYTGKNTMKENMPPETPFMHGYPPGVYCCAAIDNTNIYTGSWSGYYFAFDQGTGRMIWRTKTQAFDFGGLPDSSAPTLWKGNLYVQKKGAYIAALDRETGKINWEIVPQPGYLQNATVGAMGDKIYGSVVRHVVRLPYHAVMMAWKDVENGSEKLWAFPLP